MRIKIIRIVIYLFFAITISLKIVASGVNPFIADKLTIIHTNDLHGRLKPFVYENKGLMGGAARRAHIIDDIKMTYKNVLVLDAGDFAQGTLYYKLFGGEANYNILEKSGYDAIELGNHEFDKPVKVLEEMVKSAKVPFLCANIEFQSPILKEKVKDYIIKDYEGFKVGVIGVITEEIKTLSSHAPNATITDPIDAVRQAVKDIDDKTDLIVVLSHAGYEKDLEIAKDVENIDVIVGGHTHTLLTKPTVIYNDAGRVLIVQDSSFGHHIGRLDVNIKDDKISKYYYKLMPVTQEIKPDEQIQTLVKDYSQSLKAYEEEIVGSLGVDLDVRKSTICVSQAKIGALVSESIKAKIPYVDIVFQNSGALRGDKVIPKGKITKADIFSLHPFENKVVTLEIKGVEIKSILEKSVRVYPEPYEGYLQSCNITYDIDVSVNPVELEPQTYKILKQGNRIKNIKVGGEPLKLDKFYKVALNDFLYKGGDGYKEFEKGINVNKTNISIDYAIIDYIRTHTPVVF